jgi:hypothetical protein
VEHDGAPEALAPDPWIPLVEERGARRQARDRRTAHPADRTASFLACLDCKNARALPHQLPVQVSVRDRLLAQRPNLDPTVWRVRYETPVHQLEDIMGSYTPAEREAARRSLGPDQERLVSDLLAGRLDLR